MGNNTGVDQKYYAFWCTNINFADCIVKACRKLQPLCYQFIKSFKRYYTLD